MLPLVLEPSAPSIMLMSAPARTSSVPAELVLPLPVVRAAFCSTLPTALNVMLPLPVITFPPTVMLEPTPPACTRILPEPTALIALPIVSPSFSSIEPAVLSSTTEPSVLMSDCVASVITDTSPLSSTRLTNRSPVLSTVTALASVTNTPPAPVLTLSVLTSVSMWLPDCPKPPVASSAWTRSTLA